jgi:hypothetical protein
MYVKTARLDTNDVTPGALDFRTGVTGGQLAITVGIQGARIAGTVVDGDGTVAPAGSRVLLILDGTQAVPEVWRETSIDSDGTYAFRGVAPGQYRLAAVAASESPGEQQLAKARLFELREGDRLKEDLKVVHAQ